MHRRQFIAAGVAAATTGLAGCRSMFQTRSARSPPLVDDRPDAVYYPTHVEGMEMAGTTEVGDYGVALTYSFPHRFWLTDTDETTKVEVGGEDSVHLMSTVWDAETGTVVPNSAVGVTVERDGETVAERGSLWSMLSQNMGVHAGDNVVLDGDGTYDVQLAIGPVSARRTGAFRDRFGERVTASFTLEFSQSDLEDISFERLTDQQGERGAVDPMEMDMVPVAQAPAPDALPGEPAGTVESGDATFAVTRLPDPPAMAEAPGGEPTPTTSGGPATGEDATPTAGADGTATPGENGAGDEDGDGYLAVSPRTPYNAYPLPFMSLSARVTRGVDEVMVSRLRPTFDPDLGYHYGAVGDVQAGDEVAISVDLGPQIARHEGYETAFFDFEAMSITL
jgi:hypothetical protein